MSIESVMPCNHLILCRPLLLLPPIPPSITKTKKTKHFKYSSVYMTVSNSLAIPTRTYCIAQGSLLNVMWQPGWEKAVGENGYMYMYGWVPLLSTWKYRNIVNGLYSNIKYCLLLLVDKLCLTLCDTMDCSPPGSSVHGILQARILEWVGHSLFQGIFLTQGLNPCLLHRKVDSLPLSHQGSP